MARKKGKSNKDKGPAQAIPRGRPRPGRFSSPPHSSRLPAAQEAAMSRFSLADEARWTSGHRTTAFDSGKKLRRMPIEFVSAGCLEGTIPEKAPQAVEPASPALSASSPSPPPSPVNAVAMARMTIRSPSAASDLSSGDEVVLFKGRSAASVASVAPAPSIERRAPPAASSAVAIPQLTGASSEEKPSLRKEMLPSADKLPTVATHLETDVESDTNSVVQDLFAKRRGGRPIWEGRTTEWVSRSKAGIGWLPVPDRPAMNAFVRYEVNRKDASMEDYVQNLEESGLKDEVASSAFARREIDLDAGSHNDWETDSAQAVEPENGDDWNSDMLHDFDNISTSSDIIDTVGRIISKRTRPSGLQYLAVYQSSTVDDARWLPATFFRTPSDRKLVERFEAGFEPRGHCLGSSSASDLESEEEEEDEETLELDDETMARVLQKQEELGLGSDEIMLFGGDTLFNGSVNRVDAPLTFDRPSKRRQHRAGGGRRSEPIFPSASAMADALDMDPYAGFDIMDTERPSLRPRKKGRRFQLPAELEESDLNDQLQAAWEADRAKKRVKKAEREQLRKQGLLGRKGKAPNLSVKYKDGVNVDEVLGEIRNFLVSDMQTLSLPPMEAHRRAVIHQLVAHLNITSKSRGDGADRFTVLSKTKRTICDDRTFEDLVERKRFRNRFTFAPAHPRGPKAAMLPKSARGLKARPTVSYRDGETVGASAPELGADNVGHRLLSKMGWSKGMALGAQDNKGILHPIAHVVKINKAGLQ